MFKITTSSIAVIGLSVIKSNKQLSLLFFLPIILQLEGCATAMTSDKVITNSYESDVSGKTIRSIAVGDEWIPFSEDSFLHRVTSASLGPGLLFRRTWNESAQKYRWVNTFTHTGSAHYSGYYAPSFSLIPDNVSTVEKGDIIDVLYMKEQYNHDYDKLQGDRVVRLVCKKKDSACIDGIKKSNKWGKEFGFEAPAVDEVSLKYTPVR